MNKTPERLKELREERGLSKSGLAKLLGKEPKTICRWEDGEKDLGADNIILLCQFFNCSADYLLGLTNE